MVQNLEKFLGHAYAKQTKRFALGSAVRIVGAFFLASGIIRLLWGDDPLGMSLLESTRSITPARIDSVLSSVSGSNDRVCARLANAMSCEEVTFLAKTDFAEIALQI